MWKRKKSWTRFPWRETLSAFACLCLSLAGARPGETATFLDLRTVKPGLLDADIVYLVNPNGVALCDPNGTPKAYPTVAVSAGTYVLDVSGLSPDGAAPYGTALVRKTGTPDTYHLGVLVFDTGGSTYTEKVQIPDAATPSSVATRNGMTFYVGDSGAQPIKQFNWDGSTFSPGVSVDAGNTGNASAVAMDSSGSIYFAKSNTIYKYDGTTTSSLVAPATHGLDSVVGVAVDSSGCVYAAGLSGTNTKVKKFNAAGGVLVFLPGGADTLSAWRTAGATPSIACDGSFVYIAQGDEQRKYSGWTGSNALFGATTLPSSNSVFSPAPGAVAVDPNGAIFVGSEISYGGQKTVLERYTQNGLVDGAFTPPVPFNGTPFGKDFCSGANRVIFHKGDQWLYTYDAGTGAKIGAGAGKDPQNLTDPIVGVTVDGSGVAYITRDVGGNVHSTYPFTFNPVTSTWTQGTAKDNLTDADGIVGIAVDSSGGVYAANAKGGVYKSTPAGGWTKIVSNAGTTTDWRRIVQDPNANSSTLKTDGTVYRYDASGTPLGSYSTGTAGWGTGLGADPNGTILFAGTGSNAIVRFDSSGSFIPFSQQPVGLPTPTPTPVPGPGPQPSPTPQPTSSPTSTPEPSATPVPTSTPMPTATPAPTSTPAPTGIPVPSGEPTPGPSPTPLPRPTNDPAKPTIAVTGGTPLASPSPLPPDVTPVPTGRPGANVDLARDILQELLGDSFDGVEILSTVNGETTSFLLGGSGGSVAVDVRTELTEENGVVYRYALLLLDKDGVWRLVGSGSRPASGSFDESTSRLSQSEEIIDNGSRDWNPTSGVIELRKTEALLAAAKATSTPQPSGAGGGGCAVGGGGLLLPLLLFFAPFVRGRR